MEPDRLDISCRETEQPFTARKDVFLGGADAPNRIVCAVKGLRTRGRSGYLFW